MRKCKFSRKNKSGLTKLRVLFGIIPTALGVLNFIGIAVCMIIDHIFNPEMQWVRRMFRSPDDTVMIPSLLALWALIAAILVYYLGRKDETLYGLSGWGIISCCMQTWQKVIVCFALFADLCLSIFLIIKWSPFTSVYIAGFLLLALLYSFYVVAAGTRRDTMLQLVKILLKQEVSHTRQGSDCKELKTVLSSLDYTMEEDVDFLSEILEVCFLPDEYCGKEKDKTVVSFETLRGLYRSIRLVIPMMEEKTAVLFVRNLLSETHNLDVWSAVGFPLLELQEQGEGPDIQEVISGLAEDIENFRKLLLRMIVYEIYLEERGKRRWRAMFIEEYVSLLDSVVTRQDIEYMVEFWVQLYEYTREVTGQEKLFTQMELRRVMDLEK